MTDSCDKCGRPFRKYRSSLQSRYYFGVVVRILMEHHGYSKDEMHQCIKWQFLRKESEGKPPTVGSTKNLSTKEFSELMERICQWAAEDGTYIPPPNHPEAIKLMDEWIDNRLYNQ